MQEKTCEEKNAFEVAFDDRLDGATKGASEDAPSLGDLHKDVQESAFEVAPKILL